ncbi:MAG: hypothetical protein EZS28_011796 [Streblomastix strix]|uniref:Uncharacterized protein n=1 Tax=Streblomastix strix TaxID=222440 RepID=A0A5J4WDA6_9EUKA|nr:MAG: hypothetical protein EZS28_011796 [Streblomastix strix]
MLTELLKNVLTRLPRINTTLAVFNDDYSPIPKRIDTQFKEDIYNTYSVEKAEKNREDLANIIFIVEKKMLQYTGRERDCLEELRNIRKKQQNVEILCNIETVKMQKRQEELQKEIDYENGIIRETLKDKQETNKKSNFLDYFRDKMASKQNITPNHSSSQSPQPQTSNQQIRNGTNSASKIERRQSILDPSPLMKLI